MTKMRPTVRMCACGHTIASHGRELGMPCLGCDGPICDFGPSGLGYETPRGQGASSATALAAYSDELDAEDAQAAAYDKGYWAGYRAAQRVSAAHGRGRKW